MDGLPDSLTPFWMDGWMDSLTPWTPSDSLRRTRPIHEVLRDSFGSNPASSKSDFTSPKARPVDEERRARERERERERERKVETYAGRQVDNR